jgi:hypothetical protein
LIDLKELLIQLCEEYKMAKNIRKSIAQAKTENWLGSSCLNVQSAIFSSVQNACRQSRWRHPKGSAPQIDFVFADSENSGSVDRNARWKL